MRSTWAQRARAPPWKCFARWLEQPADVVVVGAGGFPKDINLYQAQKALDNARHVVRQNGILVLVADCREGLGEATFESWMRDPGGPDAILRRIRREFVLGGHKAAAVAMTMRQVSISLVSSLQPDFARSLGFTPWPDVNCATQGALKRSGSNPFVLVLPEGGSVLPSIRVTGGADSSGTA